MQNSVIIHSEFKRFMHSKQHGRLDFRRSLVSGLPFPEQRLVIEPSNTGMIPCFVSHIFLFFVFKILTTLPLIGILFTIRIIESKVA